MKKLLLAATLLAFAAPSASAYSLFAPCKPIAHHLKKVKPQHKALAKHEKMLAAQTVR